MLIEIYDYAAKLLNNMSATTVGIINNLASAATKTKTTTTTTAAETKEKAITTTTASSRTRTAAQLLRATSNNMKQLLNKTLATMARANLGEHVGAPYRLSTLLLHGSGAISASSNNTDDSPAAYNSSTGFVSFDSFEGSGSSNHTISSGGGNNNTSLESNTTDATDISGFIESSTTAASTALSAAITTLPLPTLPTVSSTAAAATASTAAQIMNARTVATFITAGNKSRTTTIVVYPTVSPESIVIPIVSCIFGFPILALIVICCLRRRAKLARERDRRRNYDMQDHAVSLVRFSPIHRLNYRSSRAISLRPERSLSQGFTSLELDTVLEERCSDVEQTQTEILNPESPMDTNSYKMSFSSS
ncbi:uncharacterized protein LOC115629501 [Scaptodrosophila lebanonensis]|uniref:Uncharacterized protein LOC115629501 n=1 Tax=Drosophila lebanonensis TaxID=7225 RepID=A0A6J2U1S3_DROLE|nr:uncharacterized protein LOC115629501 [Scaptodrosophila lebanonensis]